ncbi:MAG: T9SS type A sorting domain-containing protein [Bacteroidota bacterium]
MCKIDFMMKLFPILISILVLKAGLMMSQSSVTIEEHNFSINSDLTKKDSQNQNRCATPAKVNLDFENWMSGHLKKQEQFVNAKKASLVYTIPIIFHIIHTGQSVGVGYNISATRINGQIDRLNADFRKLNTDLTTHLTQPAFLAASADVEINFCAAIINPLGASLSEPGIDRINAVSKGWNSPPYVSLGNDIENVIKPASIWDPTKYFNVWVLNFNDGTLGYAQYPSVPIGIFPIIDLGGESYPSNTDGVVLDYLATGITSGRYNLGRTLVHEAGHWLGLLHTNGDSNCGDDFVSDTPAQSALSGTCPLTNGIVVAAGCGTLSPNPPGKMYQNYMDYSDDKCAVVFTNGQKARMQAVMENCINRNSLSASTVCGSVGVNEIFPKIKMTIFPNPSNGEVNISLNTLNAEDYNVSVVNILGEMIEDIKQKNISNESNLKIDLSQRPKGVYFISVKTKSSFITKRIVIQ